MWEYVLGGATIFGAIVAVAAWLNGRATRRFLAQLICQESKATRELISAMDSGLKQILQRMDSKLDAIYSQVRATGSNECGLKMD